MRATKALLAVFLALACAVPVSAGQSNFGSAYLANYNGSLLTWTPNSASVVTMGGLAGSITPSRTGNIRICAFGYVTNSATTAAGGIINFQLSYGTGTAPTANAALTGTQIGPALKVRLASAAAAAGNIAMTLDECANVTGLTVGTAYWIDVCGEGVVTNLTSTWNGAISAEEI